MKRKSLLNVTHLEHHKLNEFTLLQYFSLTCVLNWLQFSDCKVFVSLNKTTVNDLFSSAENYISSLKCIRSKWRRWVKNHSSSRNRRVMPQPVASATKQSLLMAVAITVRIAKLNSVHAVEEECLYGQIRYGVMKV